MNEQLLKFIELCLIDGVITEKEREVIFRKATEFGVDIDECEIILDSMIHQKNMSQNETISKNEVVTIINSDRDSLFREAAEIVVEAQQGSESLLQRKLKLGSNRAGRIIDALEKAGIVGEFDGINQRSVNIPNLELLEHFFTSGEIRKLENKVHTKNINENDLLINKLNLLGLNPTFTEYFKSGGYNKISKVLCYLSEPIYAKGNKTVQRWRDTKISFLIPSNGKLEEKNMAAFIKANWSNYKIFIEDKTWITKGSKYDSYPLDTFDKRKLEIIEIIEII